jgi:T-complex protein 1 subunit delta
LAKSQDVEVGDGTTSVICITGGLLDASQELLSKGIHPSVIADAFLDAQKQSEKILKSVAIPIELTDRNSLIHNAMTSLNSKVCSCVAAASPPIDPPSSFFLSVRSSFRSFLNTPTFLPLLLSMLL